MNKVKWLLVIAAVCLVPVWAANYAPCQVGIEGSGEIQITTCVLRIECGEQILTVYAPFNSVIVNYEDKARKYSIETVCNGTLVRYSYEAPEADCDEQTPGVSFREGIAVGAIDWYTSGMTVNATITSYGGYPKTTYFSDSDSTEVNL